MKKVLIMNDLVSGGGVEKVLWEVMDALIENNNQVTLLTPKKEKLPDNKSIKYMYYSEKTGIFSNVKKALKIIRYYIEIYNQDYDYVIAMKEGRCMKYVRWMHAKKKFAWVHVDYDQLYYTKKKFKIISELNYMRAYNQVFCVSNQVKNSVIHKVGDPGNLEVLYNPMNIQSIIKKSEEKVEDFQYDKKKILLVAVGRLSKEKGMDRLAAACVALKNRSEEFEVLIIGDGPERESLESKISKYGLKNITLLGKRDNPYKYIRIADYFLNVSRTESFGLSIYEALLCGKKCMITNCAGAVELFSEENNGWVVQNSTKGVCEGITWLLEHKPDSQNFDTNNISKKCDIKNILERFE